MSVSGVVECHDSSCGYGCRPMHTVQVQKRMRRGSAVTSRSDGVDPDSSWVSLLSRMCCRERGAVAVDFQIESIAVLL